MLLAGLPAPGEFFNFRAELIRQHHLERDVFVPARAVTARDTPSFEPQYTAGIGAFRNSHAYAAGWRRDIELSSQHRLGQADWQLDVDVIIFPSEQFVRAHFDFGQSIPRRCSAYSRPSLLAQAKDLMISRSRRDHDIEGRAIGHGNAFRRAVHGFEELDGEPVMHILTPDAEMRASLATAQDLRENILVLHEIRVTPRGGVGM